MWRKMSRNFVLAIAAVMVFVMESAFATSGRVTQDGLPVFNTPSFTQSELAGYLYSGEIVEVIEVRGDWAQIARGNRIGYTGAKYLERISESSNYDSPVPGYTTQAVSIYVSPSTSAAVLATLPWNTKVSVIGTVNGFCKVKSSGNGTLGYIKSNYLSKTEQKFEIGYTTQETAIYAAPSSTSQRLAVLAPGTQVRVIGVEGECCHVVNLRGTSAGYIYRGHLSRTKNNSQGTLRDRVEKVDWFESASHVLKHGAYYTLYDANTNQYIRIKYTTGSSHMDIEPATAEDTAKLKAALGGKWTWERTPFILIAEGKYIAASLYGEPHGSTDTIANNNMDGVVCLHLTNSRTHGTDRVCEDHQAAIQRAYNWAHS